MPQTRCKFRVIENKRQQGSDVVTLCPEYSESPEDRTFSATTPSGKLEINVTNRAVIGKFMPGDFYFLDLTPVAGPGRPRAGDPLGRGDTEV